MRQRGFDLAAIGLLAYLSRCPPQPACPAIPACPVHSFSCGVIPACPACPARVAPACAAAPEAERADACPGGECWYSLVFVLGLVIGIVACLVVQSALLFVSSLFFRGGSGTVEVQALEEGSPASTAKHVIGPVSPSVRHGARTGL